jgi:hypothetical protein
MRLLKTWLLLVLIMSGISSFAQFSRISGKIADTTENKSMANASILLLKKADSVMVRVTRTDKTGHFTLPSVPPGNYLILATYPAYADYVDTLNVKDSAAMELPLIGMTLKSKLLEAVVVSGNKGAIHIKGDTVEFRADSFHTQAGATVEDLLKKLPGIQVDRNGKITAQGETVQKVLVDGEEFFGDDPTLVTQNLKADMVDKVQVYDKKSDQAVFTGIDDGQRTKTINLKLKDSKKNGYFGKVSGGIGTDGYYDGQVMANYFKKKMKVAGYGIFSNTGKTGLNWQDRDNYGQSIFGLADYDEGTGNFSINIANNDLDSWSGRFEGQGLPTVSTGGLHFNNKSSDEMRTVNGNIKTMQLDVNGESETNSKNILPDTLYYNTEKKTFRNSILRQSFDGSYEIKFDTSSSIKVMADGGMDHKTTFNTFASAALASDSSLVNSNNRTISTTGDAHVLNSNILWRKKLQKKGRTLSINFRENYNNNVSSGYLNSELKTYANGMQAGDSLTDQYKDYHTETVLLDSKITYTEPLSAVSFLVGNYGLTSNNNHSDRSSYNKNSGGKYSVLDSLFSNDYQYNILTNSGGLAYNLVKKKLRISAGTNVGFAAYTQRDMHADTAMTRHFINWFPLANMNYSFTNQRRINFNYWGSTNPPSLTQIQPILTNEDPLNITIGNPNLKPQFQNRLNLGFFDYKVLTDRSIWTNVNYSFTQNAISTRSNVDSIGKRTTQYINVNGNYRLGFNINYDFKWVKPDIHIGPFGNMNLSNNVSVVQGLVNTTHSGNYTFGFGIYKSKDKKYEFSLRPSASYTESYSSINRGVVTDYWTYSISSNLQIFLPWKFQINGDADINIRPKSATFPSNNNVYLVNAWIGKKLLKNDALLIKAAVNDLLNQNVGFNRTVNSNFISQNTYTTIQRYFMFSVVWNFTKAGTPAPQNGN